MSGASTRPSRSRARAPPPISTSLRVVAAARKAGCDAVHPGYGFLSENADFAAACAAAGITFVGPTPEQLEVVRRQGARPRPCRRSARCRCCPAPMSPILAGATAFFKKHAKSGIALKAIAGGGGRGMRLIRTEGEIADAFARAARRGQVGVRQRRPLCRASGRPRAPHRGADRRRRQGRHRSPGRARMHPAAAQPEDRRGGAQPQPRAGGCARRSSPLPSPWPRP